jgi:glucose-1-phosphate cytidylyltransferase
MKAVLLAGGLGTRLSEETDTKPKPMVEIGGMPILWHIMKLYGHFGVNDFIICLGYKGNSIKSFFHNYALNSSDVTVDFSDKSVAFHHQRTEGWRVSLIDTGLHTMTGGRLRNIKEFLSDDEPFFMTYGDGVGSINISESLKFHTSHGKKATVTAVTPPGRFGVLDIDGVRVNGFREKLVDDQYRINAGFFVLEKSVIDYIDDSSTSWERAPMEKLARDGELMAYLHDGFWQPMDTLRDKNGLETMWNDGKAAWRIWI